MRYITDPLSPTALQRRDEYWLCMLGLPGFAELEALLDWIEVPQ